MSLPPMLKMLGLTEETVGEFQQLMKVLLSLPERLYKIECRIEIIERRLNDIEIKTDTILRRIDELADAMAPRYINSDEYSGAADNITDDEMKLRLASVESVAHQHGLGSGLP